MYRKLLRLAHGGLLALGVSAMPLCAQQAAAADSPPWVVKKRGVPLDIRSHGRMLWDRLATAGTLVSNGQPSVVAALPDLGLAPQSQVPQGNIQVNDASLDHIMRISGSAPRVLYTQSETSLAVYGSNIVAVYNTSVFQAPSYLFGTGFSTSIRRGRGGTWTSGFLPPVQKSSFTFGDPSVAVDRLGHFYAAGMGLDAKGNFTIQLNTSTNGGITWSNAVVVQQDDSGDKPWMTVGRDPFTDRDNVYVTWTSFQSTGTQLRFGRSIDGGATWSAQILPVSNPNLPDSLSYSVPFVDASTSILYIPFLHFGPESFEQDFIRILKSTDAGQTFSFVNFNVKDAPDRTLLPMVPAGEVTDCGTDGGFRLTIHASSDNDDVGRNGLPRFVRTSRLIHQPAFAARKGVLYLAWLNSNGAAGSDVLFMRSDDEGKHWTKPIQVNPTVQGDIHHVLPTLAINDDPSDLHPTIYISYYTQHSDETVDVDTASARDGGGSFTAVRLTSTPFALAPTNVPLPTPQDPFNTVNFDNMFNACYNLGEYMSAKVANGSSYVLWSDSRNLVTEPISRFDPLSGQTHPQQDIFFEARPAR